MRKKILNLWTKWKGHAKRNEANVIKSHYDVCEKDGRIYLTHCGTAYAVMSEHVSAAEIAEKLNEARKAALEFEGL